MSGPHTMAVYSTALYVGVGVCFLWVCCVVNLAVIKHRSQKNKQPNKFKIAVGYHSFEQYNLHLCPSNGFLLQDHLTVCPERIISISPCSVIRDAVT